MDEKVESVKILTDKPMLNGCVTLNLECSSDDRKYWRSPELFVHPDQQETFRYRYVVKYKEGITAWLLKKVTFSGGKDDKTVKEMTTRTLKSGIHQYDIFRNPNAHNRWGAIFLGQMFFVKQLYHRCGKGYDLKEVLIECEHVGFGHPSYAMVDIDSFIQWVVEIVNKTPTSYQSVYICSLLGQFVHRVRSWSAWHTCDVLGQRTADQLLLSLGCCLCKPLPKSSVAFIKNIAEDLFKAGSSTGCLLFIKVFCNLLDVNYVMQVADKLSSQRYTEQQFHQQVPGVLDSLTRLKNVESCKRFCCYVIYHSPDAQCLWNLYRAISFCLPNLVKSLVDDFSSVYCKFISRHRARNPDLLQSPFWNQVPEELKETFANPFCKELTEQISSETNWSQERLNSLATIAQDARLQLADRFYHFILTVTTHQSKEMVSIIPVLLQSKSFCTYWNNSISNEDREKICFNWLRANFFSTGKKPKEQILDVVEACESLCATDALKTNKGLCQNMDKEVEGLVFKTKFESIMDAFTDAQKRSQAIQQRLTMLLKSAIKQQSGTGDRRLRYKKMIRLLGYDVPKERKKNLQKVKLDRYVFLKKNGSDSLPEFSGNKGKSP